MVVKVGFVFEDDSQTWEEKESNKLLFLTEDDTSDLRRIFMYLINLWIIKLVKK